MDLRTGQRTFYIGVSGTNTSDNTKTTEVHFTDTAGNVIACNYFKLQVAGTNANTDKLAVVAEVSGVTHEGDAVTDELSGVLQTPAASGICGVGVVAGYLHGAEAEWHGSNGQVCKGVKLIITPQGDTDYFIGVTYGNLLPLNELRLQDTREGRTYDRGL